PARHRVRAGRDRLHPVLVGRSGRAGRHAHVRRGPGLDRRAAHRLRHAGSGPDPGRRAGPDHGPRARPGDMTHGALHHVEIWVPDLDRTVASFGWLLERLGYTMV